MKNYMAKFLIIAVSTSTVERTCLSQGFNNMGFEDATINTSSATIPWWIVDTFDNGANGDPNNIPYNNVALDAPFASLHGTDSPFSSLLPIEGQYSIFLQGGSVFNPKTNGASILQEGLIPSAAQTLSYSGGALQARFKGQMLSFIATSNAPNFTVWTADISAYAGQYGLLTFTAPWQSSGLLDNIQFSSSPIPEPSTIALAALGGWLLGFRRRKK